MLKETLILQPDGFAARRALERLREGLFDPLAVRLLSTHQDDLDARFEAGLRRLQAGRAAHLCLCGPYGQGKSHSLTYLRQQALKRGYAVSAINLDPREVPLHVFRQVYRALLDTLSLPPTADADAAPVSLIDAWQRWTKAQTWPSEAPDLALANCLPAHMPHPFKATLVALAQSTLTVPRAQRSLKRYQDYRPGDVPITLQRTLMGETVPAARLRPALKYRQVTFYRQASLSLNGDAPFLHMTTALAQLLRRMGYHGWVLLVDEGEAMIQVRSPLRGRAYRTLHHLLHPPVPQSSLYPIFAFTPDFFQQLEQEDYDRVYFDRDYAVAWRDLSVYRLQGLKRDTWQGLCATLLRLHGRAYQWPADTDHLLPWLSERLNHLPLDDTRTTLKALVDELDQVQQQWFFAQRAEG